MLRGVLMLLSFSAIPRLVTRLMLDRRVPLGPKLIIPAAIIYLISPIDIVPDMLPALGRIDDVLVLLLAVGLFLGMAPRNVISEHVRGRGPGTGPTGKSSKSRRSVIDGSYRVVEDAEK